MSALSSTALLHGESAQRARGNTTPLLIVNADDWGYDDATTDAIHACFEAGQITSASAMVHMAGSKRAAELVKASGLPVGLHINLTEPFSDPATPAEISERQIRLIGYLGGEEPSEDPSTAKLRRWLYDPRIQDDVNASIAEQLARFVELYGRPPTHFDGHNHIDLCPNVFWSSAIPAGAKMRNTRDRFPTDRSLPGLLRAGRQAVRSRRFASTRYLLHIAVLEISDERIDPLVELADRMPVEVMCHPGFTGDNAKLTSAAWGRVMAEHKLGSFADLDTRPHRLGDWLHRGQRGGTSSA